VVRTARPAAYLQAMGVGGYEIICQSCRAAVSSEAEMCPNCGHNLLGRTSPQFLQASAASMSAPATSQGAVAATAGELSLSLPKAEPLRDGYVRYGGFWLRVAAALIDTVILLVPWFVLRNRLGRAGPLVSAIGDWLYFALMESSYNQATLGKMACGLAVTDLEGRRISFGRATGRYFAQLLCALTLGLGYAMVGWTRQKRGLHDFVAGTLVVRR
jgi:uncharacterized RDD family membrane protein YckC